MPMPGFGGERVIKKVAGRWFRPEAWEDGNRPAGQDGDSERPEWARDREDSATCRVDVWPEGDVYGDTCPTIL